jgi:glycosyltransferase involved in cell wall biosynthesis
MTVADFSGVGVRYWSVLDIYCQPSLVPSAGRTLAQAMVHGIPGIASDVPGLRSLIEPERSGLLVPPGDPVALANAIIRLIDDPDGALAMASRAARRILEWHDPEAEADRLADLYRRVGRETD